MRRFLAPAIVALLLPSAPLAAEPVLFQPDGCDFAASFDAPPKTLLLKSATDRGDTVLTYRAEWKGDVDGKLNMLRAECTKIPHMGFVDDAIFKNTMEDLGRELKLQNPRAFVEHNKLAGTVGRLRGKTQLDGRDITIELRRYFGPGSMLDLWTAAETDVFPSAAGDAFVKTATLNGQPLQ